MTSAAGSPDVDPSLEATTKGEPAATSRHSELRAPTAALFAFLGAAVVAALLGAMQPAKPRAAWLLSIALDASQHVAVGWAALLAVALFDSVAARVPPARQTRRIGLAALQVASSIVALSLVRDDVQGVALRARFLPLSDDTRITLAALLLSTALPLAAVLGRALGFGSRAARRFAPRALPLAAALTGWGVVWLHSKLLDQNYPGLHLFATLAGAIFTTGALVGAPLPRTPNIVRRGGLAALAVVALWGTLVRPPDRAVVIGARRTSAVFVPVVARAHLAVFASGGGEDGPWFRSREGLPAVPASTPPLYDEPVVILITVDALRADVLSPKNVKKLPTFGALAKSSLTFTEARSAAPATSASLAALFTGKLYSQLYWQELSVSRDQERLFPHEDTSPRFSSLLTKSGVHTFNCAAYMGFKQQFGLTVDFEEEQFPGPDASTIVRRILENLSVSGPIFMYAHLLEPHAPYSGKSKSPFANYLNDVAKVDAALGELVRGIDASPRRRSIVLIVAADHGEGFNEHGLMFHGSSVYDEMVHVPILIRAPGVKPKVIDTLVSTLDLGPTVLDLFGHEIPAGFMGESLVPLLRGESFHPTRPVVIDSSRWQQAMLFDDGFKVIVDGRLGTVELYDLPADPREQHDLAAERATLANERAARLRRFFSAHALSRPGYEKPWRK